jgi:prophage regulatory protein
MSAFELELQASQRALQTQSRRISMGTGDRKPPVLRPGAMDGAAVAQPHGLAAGVAGWSGEVDQRGDELMDTTKTAERLLRLPQVLEMTGRGRTATLDDVRIGRFPAPIKIGAVALWMETEVQAWIAERVAEHRSKGAA